MPKPEPEMALPLELPAVKPLSVLPLLSVTPLPPAFWMVTAGAPVFIAGNDALSLGGVRPVIADNEDVESCPISFCPLNKVTPPVYAVPLSYKKILSLAAGLLPVPLLSVLNAAWV